MNLLLETFGDDAGTGSEVQIQSKYIYICIGAKTISQTEAFWTDGHTVQKCPKWLTFCFNWSTCLALQRSLSIHSKVLIDTLNHCGARVKVFLHVSFVYMFQSHRFMSFWPGIHSSGQLAFPKIPWDAAISSCFEPNRWTPYLVINLRLFKPRNCDRRLHQTRRCLPSCGPWIRIIKLWILKLKGCIIINI